MDNRAGIVVAWSADGVIAEHNRVHGNIVPIAAEVTVATTLDARHNWWGSPSGVTASDLDISGDVTVRLAPPCSDAECSEFEEHSLVVETAGNGTGHVTRSPVGTSYRAGTVVTLIAIPAPGSEFGGWEGDCAGSDAQTTVELSGDLRCLARFVRFDPSQLTVHVEGEIQTPVVPRTTTSLEWSGDRDASALRLSVPADALRAATTLSAAAVSDVAGLSHRIPAGEDTLVGAFLLRALDASGSPVTSLAASVLSLELRLPITIFPPETSTDEVVLALWTGERWREVPTSVTTTEGGTLVIAGNPEHLGLVGVLHQQARGGLIPAPDVGANAAIWGGGPASHLPRGASYWISHQGGYVAYEPGAPGFVNAPFLDVFQDEVIPSGAIVIVLR